jgi:ADP-ribose pyrophosphatase
MAREPKAWERVSDGDERDYHVLRVREITARDPRDGSLHPRVIISSSDWVNIIPVTTDEQVVMIRQFRFGVWANTLEIPGGMTERGEDPARAAARELEEETGYRPREVIALGMCHPNPAVQTNRTFSFLALGCEKVSEGMQDAGEDIAVELFPRAQVDALIREGKITHALVLTAFLFEKLGPTGR